MRIEFHPDRCIYVENIPHPIEGSVLPLRMGMEIPLREDQDIIDAWDFAEAKVNEWADARARRIMANAGSATNNDTVTVQKGKDEDVISAIQKCDSLGKLKEFELLSKSNAAIQATYFLKRKELANPK